MNKVYGVTEIKQQTGTGFRKFNQAIYEHEGKYYTLNNMNAIRTITVNDKEYIEVEQTSNTWYVITL
jgi:hypothetical protein